VIRVRAAQHQYLGYRERFMPTVIAHHNISKGKDHWLASPKRKEFFGPLTPW
jgi:hypothetical protein